MKLLTLSDRLWSLGMTGAVYGAVIPTLLILGAGVGRAPVRPSALKTFDVALPHPAPEPETAPTPRAALAAQPSLRSDPAVPPPPNPSPQEPGASNELVHLATPVPFATEAASEPPVPTQPVRTVPKSGDPSVLTNYAARLWAHIAARRPPGVRLEGITTVSFSVTQGGDVGNVAVSARSGDPMLDQLAVRTVRRASPFPRPPEGIDDAKLHFTIPFSFR